MNHAKDPSPPFGAFLCYKSSEKGIVCELADALELRGLRPWLDIRELKPGRPKQEQLEQIIEKIPAAIVVVGQGEGPWQKQERRAILEEFIRRDLPIIPVLLEDVPSEPKLPIFLRGFSGVSLAQGITEDVINRLEWGITGQKPEHF